jgi:hypothetical protein
MQVSWGIVSGSWPAGKAGRGATPEAINTMHNRKSMLRRSSVFIASASDR